jgi:hypothetical protein
MYVYKETEKGLYTVGFYDPSGNWHPESDHDSKKKAGDRVRYLNGGKDNEKTMEKIKGDCAICGCPLLFQVKVLHDFIGADEINRAIEKEDFSPLLINSEPDNVYMSFLCEGCSGKLLPKDEEILEQYYQIEYPNKC